MVRTYQNIPQFVCMIFMWSRVCGERPPKVTARLPYILQYMVVEVLKSIKSKNVFIISCGKLKGDGRDTHVIVFDLMYLLTYEF